MKSPFAVEKIRGHLVYDSRGFSTIEVEAHSGSIVARATAPAGVSKGRFEAHDLRDEESFMGMGVQKALRNVNGPINSELKDANAVSQADVDKALIELDGTPNKSKLGANAMIATSMAVARLGAMLQDKPLYEHLHTISALGKTAKTHPSLPLPLVNVLNGGKHAGNELPFQEFLITPTKAKSMADALQICSEIYQTLRVHAGKNFDARATNVGESGGLALPTSDVRVALDAIMSAAKEVGHEKQIKIGLSIAGSHLRKKGVYLVDGKPLTHRQLVNYYANLVEQYPISILEDPFAEDDLQGFQGLVSRIGNTHPIVGDDLLVSSPTRIKRVLDLKACNGLNLKPNQVGTVSEAIEAFHLARDAKWTIVVSDRAGETEDTFISDLAVGISADYLKAGGFARSERVAKYNRLLRIEEELGKKAVLKK